MNEKMAPNNVAALLLIVLFFSQLSVTTGGSDTRDKARADRTAQSDESLQVSDIIEEVPAEEQVPAIFEKPLEEVLEEGEIRRRRDIDNSQISTEPFSHERLYITAKLFRIKYEKKERTLHVEMGIDTLFSKSAAYVSAHRRQIAARFFVGYNSWTSGLVDKIIIEDIPVRIAIKFNYWHTGKEKELWGDVVEEQTYAGRRELIDACGILPPELDYHGVLDLGEWRDK